MVLRVNNRHSLPFKKPGAVAFFLLEKLTRFCYNLKSPAHSRLRIALSPLFVKFSAPGFVRYIQATKLYGGNKFVINMTGGIPETSGTALICTRNEPGGTQAYKEVFTAKSQLPVVYSTLLKYEYYKRADVVDFFIYIYIKRCQLCQENDSKKQSPLC